MYRTISPREMKRVENRVMDQTSITGEALMHTAAAHVARAVMRRDTSYVLCLCGTGNNGGDGLAAMRLLLQMDEGFHGECWVMPGQLSTDAQRELELLTDALSRQPRVILRRVQEALPVAGEKPTCIIDALFGTGLSRPLDGLALEACRWMNAANAPVVAVDIPSGINGETGDALGMAVHADETVTFHRPKPGLYLKEGPDYAGKITVADIGLNVPEAAALDDAPGMRVLQRCDLPALLPPRRRNSHKGSYGRVVIWAGSKGMAGAAAISAAAALRAGAGLVTIACPESIWTVLQTLCPCATCVPLPKGAREAWPLLEAAIRRADTVALGCGLGQSEETACLLEKLLDWLQDHPKPAMIDADALNLLAALEGPVALPNAVLTPHPAEAARLLGCRTEQVVADAPAAARALNQKYGSAIVLKGTCSVLCDGEEMALNPYGTPAMAKGGSGDALTGVLAALVAGCAAGAYQMDRLALLQTGCALHGLAGMEAEKAVGQRGVLVTDLCGYLGLDYGETAEEQPVVCTPLGTKVTVTVEHKAGQQEPGRAEPYRLNCGYVQEVLARRNEWQNACVLDVTRPVEWFEGYVVATALVDGESLWLVSAEKRKLTKEQAAEALAFLGCAKDMQIL